MWEYAALFDVPDKPTALELAMRDPDWWTRKGCDLWVGQMGYQTNTTLAGDTLVAEVYPRWGRKQRGKVRAAKKNETAERIQKYNEQRAKFNLMLLLDTNFTEKDLSLTITYTAAPTEAEAARDVKNFLERIRTARRRNGLPPLKYVYALEDERDGKKKQLHCHIVMNGGLKREDVEAIWKQGKAARGYANCDQLQPDNEGFRRLAFYVYDQNRGKERAKGKRHYSCSKNLDVPKVRNSKSRVSKGMVRKLARDFNAVAPTIMEKVYPGFEFVRGLRYAENESGTFSESCVRFSDYTDGVYIRVMMRRRKRGTGQC